MFTLSGSYSITWRIVSWFQNHLLFQTFIHPFLLSISLSLVVHELYYRLAERVRSEKNVSDFFIDASHELSLFAWNKGKGHQLTEAPYFCLDRKSSKTSRSSTLVRQSNNADSGSGEENGCAIYSRSHDDSITQSHLYSLDTATGTTKPSFVSVSPKIISHHSCICFENIYYSLCAHVMYDKRIYIRCIIANKRGWHIKN